MVFQYERHQRHRIGNISHKTSCQRLLIISHTKITTQNCLFSFVVASILLKPKCYALKTIKSEPYLHSKTHAMVLCNIENYNNKKLKTFKTQCVKEFVLVSVDNDLRAMTFLKLTVSMHRLVVAPCSEFCELGRGRAASAVKIDALEHFVPRCADNACACYPTRATPLHSLPRIYYKWHLH